MTHTLRAWVQRRLQEHTYRPADVWHRSAGRRGSVEEQTGWQMADLEHASGVSRHAVRRLLDGARAKVEHLVPVLDVCNFELHIHHRDSGGRWRIDAVPGEEAVVELVEHDDTPLTQAGHDQVDHAAMRGRVEVLLACAEQQMQPLRLRGVLEALELDHATLAAHPAVTSHELLQLIRARAFFDLRPASAS